MSRVELKLFCFLQKQLNQRHLFFELPLRIKEVLAKAQDICVMQSILTKLEMLLD